MLCEFYFASVINEALLKWGLLLIVVLLFYVLGKHLRSCRDGQLT